MTRDDSREPQSISLPWAPFCGAAVAQSETWDLWHFGYARMPLYVETTLSRTVLHCLHTPTTEGI